MNNSPYSNNRNRKLRYGAAACILALSMGLAACGGDSAIDAPPSDVESEMLRAVEGNNSPVSGTSIVNDAEQASNITVYVTDRHGYLAPVSYNLAANDASSLATQGLNMLIQDDASTKQLPEGFQATLPSGTQVKQVTIQPEQKLAIVEFSKQFGEYKPEQERRILESITWTLTSMADVDQVQLWMDSERLTTMPAGGTPIDKNLTRSYGINLEKADHVNYMNSMPVMIYFTALTLDGRAYYVPVTRLVEPSDDPVQSALDQLIIGPQDTRLLNKVATDETKITSIQNGDTITVDISDSMWAERDKIPADLLKSVVLSLTELPSIAKVQVIMNGKTNITGSDGKDYSQPVTRPAVNQALKS